MRAQGKAHSKINNWEAPVICQIRALSSAG